jgi:hypothetical protein
MPPFALPRRPGDRTAYKGFGSMGGDRGTPVAQALCQPVCQPGGSPSTGEKFT